MTSPTLKDILKEYDIIEDDFGFTAVTEDEMNATLDQAVTQAEEETVAEYKIKLLELEKLIIPFLAKLLKTNETYIKWPPEVRKPMIEKQLEKILRITRS